MCFFLLIERILSTSSIGSQNFIGFFFQRFHRRHWIVLKPTSRHSKACKRDNLLSAIDALCPAHHSKYFDLYLDLRTFQLAFFKVVFVFFLQYLFIRLLTAITRELLFGLQSCSAPPKICIMVSFRSARDIAFFPTLQNLRLCSVVQNFLPASHIQWSLKNPQIGDPIRRQE